MSRAYINLTNFLRELCKIFDEDRLNQLLFITVLSNFFLHKIKEIRKKYCG